MRIKKFIASNMQEGREMIASELGGDAIILSNRNTKLSNGAPAIEIVAALDEKKVLDSKSKTAPYANSTLLNPTNDTAAEGIKNEVNKRLIAEITALKDMISILSDNVKYKYTGTMPTALARIYKILRDSDISEELALDMSGRIANKGLSNEFNQALAEAKKLS